MDKRFATLVLCWFCNGSEVTDKKKWPEVRQLALLLTQFSLHFDLRAYLLLTNSNAPNRITVAEVQEAASGLPLSHP